MTNGNGHGQPRGKEPVERVIDLFVHTPIGLAVMAWKRVPGLVSSMPDLVGQALSKGCAQLSEAEERLSEEVRKARMIGQVAVHFGGRHLRREVDARLRDARQAAGGVANFRPGPGTDGGPNGAGTPEAASVSATETPSQPASAPEAPVTPAARAGKATAKATGSRQAGQSAPRKAPATKAAPAKATPAKAASVKAARAKTATPKAAPAKATPPGTAADLLPIREYDGLSASQVVSRLTGLTPEELRAVRAYEAESRGRRTVLVAIDRLLD